MDRRQQNDNSIPKNSGSRFSDEERARMSRENLRESVNRSGDSSKQKRTNGRIQSFTSEKRNSLSAEKSGDTSAVRNYSEPSERRGGGRARSAEKKEEGSLNDRIKKSSEIRRKNNKRKNNTFFALLVIVVISLSVVVAAFLLRVNAIEVNGSERYSDSTILDAVKLDTSDSMLLLNLGYMESKLEVSLPYIETAEIKRVWPDKIVVSITDAVPSLAVDTGEGYILMNNSCKILDTDSVVLPAGTALVRGISLKDVQEGKTAVFDSDISFEEFTKLTLAFDTLGLEGVTEYDLTSVSNVVLIIDYRIEVKLGTLAGADEKLAFGKYIIEKTIEENPDGVFVINISADGKAYVRDMYDNNVNFDEQTTVQETTTGEDETSTEEITTEEIPSSFG